MDFTKMTGAGNDFIMFEAGSALSLKPEAMRLLCDRRYGIGADGLMIIHGPAAASTGGAGTRVVGAGAVTDRSAPAFSVDFHNADGSGGMLCGNGARCALVYAARQGLIAYGKPAAFSFAGKCYSGIALAPDRARFMLDPRYSTRLEDRVPVGELLASGRYIDLGSLHFVVDLADLLVKADESGELAERPQELPLEQLDVAILGAALRHHPRFAPLGVNASFCSLVDGRLQVRTFERGVEGETLACGTGSTASALSYALRGLVRPPVRVVTRSGEELIIDFDDPAKPSRLSLEGPAKVVFQGRMDPAFPPGNG
jgi:diaminopimelate epimerase